VTAVLVVSDTHLSARAPESGENWNAVVRYAQESQPDLVVHLGDMTLDGAHSRAELSRAAPLLDAVGIDWRAVPGNHDIGDNPQAGEQVGESVNEARRQHWIESIGADWWSVRLDAWTLIGINAQLFGSGLEAEEDQWAWLERSLLALGVGESAALFLHKPLAASEAERTLAPSYRFVPRDASARLQRLLDERDTPVVFSGHVHQFRDLDVAGRRHVWAPTTWAVLPDTKQPSYGSKRCGVVALELSGAGTVHAALVEPLGMIQHTLDVDIVNPYQH
jgi:3',5'-cyclic-AMP phosphodiesterase